ncbi:hypothetical protein ACWCSD_43920 [Nonomuraea sp. NPDC001684]
MPGLFIGALHFGHLPAIFVPAGPMTSRPPRVGDERRLPGGRRVEQRVLPQLRAVALLELGEGDLPVADAVAGERVGVHPQGPRRGRAVGAGPHVHARRAAVGGGLVVAGVGGPGVAAPRDARRAGVERAGPLPVLAAALAAVDLPEPGPARVGEADGRQDAVVVLAAGGPGDLAGGVQASHPVPERGGVLRLVDLDQVAVVVEGDGGGDAAVVPAVAQPGHPAVGAVRAGPVPQRSGARVVHLHDLAAGVGRDGRVRAEVALVQRAGRAVAGDHREHAAAQRVHGRRAGRVVLGPQQPRPEGGDELVVQRGRVARGVGRVVGQVVLEVEGDDDRRGRGMGRRPAGDHREPVAEEVGGRVARVVHLVAGGVVADGVVAGGGVPVVVHVELDEADAVVELVGDRVPGAVDVARVAVVRGAEDRRG